MVFMTHHVQEASISAAIQALSVVLHDPPSPPPPPLPPPPPPPISVTDNCQGFGQKVVAISANDLRLEGCMHRIKRRLHA